MNNFHEFCMELVQWKKGTSAHEHALLVTSGMKFVCARANGRTSGTAIVNVIQAAIDAGCDVAEAYIYSTSGISWACAGMARLQTRGGLIFYPGTTHALECYRAHRTHFGPVAPKAWPSVWSARSDVWIELARGGTALGTWVASIRAKNRARSRYAPLLTLQDQCATAGDVMHALAVSTGRADATLTQFFDPTATGMFDVVQQMRTPAARDEFFSLLAQELVYRLRGRVAPDVRADLAGHNIGSLMVDSAWRVVGWAVNTNSLNGTYHGETNLVQAHEAHGKLALPKGGTMYTTLEPCEMCSGVIRNAVASGDTGFRVLYIQPDRTLAQTALTRGDSPVKMSASPAASAGGTIAAGRTFGAELSARQDTLATSHQSFLAPTRFLRDDRALQVMNLAAQQRVAVSDAPALGTAQASVRRMGESAAIAEQQTARRALQLGLMQPRSAAEIRRHAGTPTGARDDSARFDVRHAPLRPEARRDDFYVGFAPRVRTVDPALVQLARDLDRLSVRFRGVLDAWLNTNGAAQTTAEKARALRQVTDFLDRAHAACTAAH
jgi:deoxycytidylate deaminase